MQNNLFATPLQINIVDIKTKKKFTRNNKMKKTLIIGNGGRESALAHKMSESSILHGFMTHPNPSIISYVEQTGGIWEIGDICDPQAVADFAQKHQIDMVMVSADNPLESGVIDELLARNIKAVGGTKAGSEIEWNKVFARELIAEIAPEMNPFYRIITSISEIEEKLSEIGDREIVVKPMGLTGGKGVKVMGEHLKDLDAAKDYIKSILNDKIGGGSKVIIEEKITGIEFTVQCISDGNNVIFPPATYDYPYRYENDTGAGTGGMGVFNDNKRVLPFIKQDHYDKACEISKKVIQKLKSQNRHFNGIMNSGFFLTNKGEIKVIEFNARFGDPECINIMSILKTDWITIMEKIIAQNLNDGDVEFYDKAAVNIYLVSPDYAIREGKKYNFMVDVAEIRNSGCEIYFSSAIHKDNNNYETVGNSRCVTIVAADDDLEIARQKVVNAIEKYTDHILEWRKDIATKENITTIQNILVS